MAPQFIICLALPGASWKIVARGVLENTRLLAKLMGWFPTENVAAPKQILSLSATTEDRKVVISSPEVPTSVPPGFETRVVSLCARAKGVAPSREINQVQGTTLPASDTQPLFG